MKKLINHQKQRSTLLDYESSSNGGGVCIYVRSKSEYQLEFLASARLSNSE